MSIDCSTNTNPLAQIDRHTREDKSLQGRLTRFNEKSPSTQYHPNSFQTNKLLINDVNQFKMEQFLGNQIYTDNKFMIKGSIPPNLPIDTQECPQQPLFHDHPSLMYKNHLSNQKIHNWSHEFRTTSTSAENQYAVDTLPSSTIDITDNMKIKSQGYIPVMRPIRSTRMNFNFYHQPQNLITHQDNSSMAQGHWDEKFKELEKEVLENLKIDEVENVEKNVASDNIYQPDFQKVWDDLQENTMNYESTIAELDNDWKNAYPLYLNNSSIPLREYKFTQEENQYSHNLNAYEIGCILMENGARLSEAALAFEAAVQQNPQHADAWLKLGLVQVQNEKELNGISALEQCLKLDSQNLQAMMTVAISYINEGYDISAFSMLNKWLRTKYSKFTNIKLNEELDRYQLSKFVTEEFLQVANKLENMDPDIQLGLGILFYSNDEFDKTVDCFKTALQVNPDDELMWNRLGASLANSNRPEEAIQAYHKALTLKPSFVRARYNLAVSSMNIGCYKEAVEHLLTSLSMHEVENSSLIPNNNNHTHLSHMCYSNNILETLKRALIAMERTDLLEKVSPDMDLQQFRNEFNF